MNPQELLEALYLGDRACKAVLVDSWRKRVALQVDVISRLKLGTKTWEFYTEADIIDGWLVFTDVSSIRFDPAGPLPNDLINNVSVKPLECVEGEKRYAIEMSVGSVQEDGTSTEVFVRIEAGGLHLEDPTKPGIEIACETQK